MSWNVDRESDGVVARFAGHLTAEDGRASALAFGEAIAREPVPVIWDLREMAGYDAGAREAWQEAVWPHRKNIRSLTVIGGGPLVRIGARMLALFIGAPARFIDA